jgi:ABC-type glycerol-3-phosphate transport system permease component
MEAARIDGASAMLFPGRAAAVEDHVAALFVILFSRLNQYLWPLVTTQESMYTTVIGIKRMIPGGDARD